MIRGAMCTSITLTILAKYIPAYSSNSVLKDPGKDTTGWVRSIREIGTNIDF